MLAIFKFKINNLSRIHSKNPKTKKEKALLLLKKNPKNRKNPKKIDFIIYI